MENSSVFLFRLTLGIDAYFRRSRFSESLNQRTPESIPVTRRRPVLICLVRLAILGGEQVGFRLQGLARFQNCTCLEMRMGDFAPTDLTSKKSAFLRLGATGNFLTGNGNIIESVGKDRF